MKNNNIITVRLSEEETAKIDIHTKGHLTRSQVLRIIIQDFLEKSEEEQRQFLVKKLFGINWKWGGD